MHEAGKKVLITGAGSGIGRALAIEASKRGMILALVGRRRDRLDETRSLLSRGTGCLVLPADVTDPAARRALRTRIGIEWGRLDVLVNNAGRLGAGPFAELDDDEFATILDVNVAAPLAMTREMLALLRVGAPSRIVNIGSMMGEIALPAFTGYSASKFALRGVSDALRRELAGLGVAVTHVAARTAKTDAADSVSRFAAPFAGKVDQPDDVARRTWDAVRRGRAVVYPRGPERLFGLLSAALPHQVDRALRRRFEASGLDRLVAETAVPPAPRHPAGASALHATINGELP